MRLLLVSEAQVVHMISYDNSILLLTRNLLKEDKCMCSKWMKCYTHFGNFESMKINDWGWGFGRY